MFNFLAALILLSTLSLLMTTDRKTKKKDKKHKKTKRNKTKIEPPNPSIKHLPPEKFVPNFTDSEGEEQPIIKDEQSRDPIEKVILPTEPHLDVGQIPLLKLDAPSSAFEYEQPWDIHDYKTLGERFPHLLVQKEIIIRN